MWQLPCDTLRCSCVIFFNINFWKKAVYFYGDHNYQISSSDCTVCANMPKCAVKGCIKTSRKTVYFSLPTDSFRKQQWLDACSISNTEPSLKICSLHFKTDDFIIRCVTEGGSPTFKKILKQTAVPNIDKSVSRNKLRLRIQKRQIRSYDLATERRLAVTAYLERCSFHTLNNLPVSSCRFNTALLCKIYEIGSKILYLESLVNDLRRKNSKLKMKCEHWKKRALNGSSYVY